MHTSIQERMLIKYLTFVTGPTNIWVITDLFKVSKERIIFQMTLVEKKVDLRVEGQWNDTKDFRWIQLSFNLDLKSFISWSSIMSRKDKLSWVNHGIELLYQLKLCSIWIDISENPNSKTTFKPVFISSLIWFIQ